MPVQFTAVRLFFNILVALVVISLSSCDSQHGKYLNGNTMEAIEIMGIKGCKDECVSVTSCLSYNFDRITLTCELKSDTATSGQVVSRESSNFEEKSDFTEDKTDPCSRANCTDFSKCVPLKCGKIQCVPYICSDDPPVIANATRTPAGTRFVIGTNVTYTCQDGYSLSGVPKVTCKANGKWTSPEFTCRAPWCLYTSFVYGAKVTGSGIYFGSNRTVKCDAGYKQISGSGPETTTCQANRQWSDLTITCEKCEMGSTFTLRKNMRFNPPTSLISTRGYSSSLDHCKHLCKTEQLFVCVAVYFKKMTGNYCLLTAQRVRDDPSYSQYYYSHLGYNEYIRNCA